VQVVISTAILLIATIIAASVFTAAALSELYTFQNTFKEVGSKNQAAYESSISIIGETNETKEGQIIVWVKNTGTTSFTMSGADGDPQYWDLFITFPNGAYTRFPYSSTTGCSAGQDGNCFNVMLLNDVSGTGIWATGETIQLTITTSQTITAGSYQVSLSLSNGVTAQDTFSF
jgi:archaellum component FlaG (FlaF/FlaG flagellin family)